MPEKETLERVEKDRREGKAPTTQAGEFIREEFHHVREGKHGAKSAKQAIAIGLSKARRAGVALPPPAEGKASGENRKPAAKKATNTRRRTARKQTAKQAPARRAGGRAS